MAKQMNDIRLETLGDNTDDLFIANGDFDIIESTEMHKKQLLVNDKGSFKESPLSCVGLPQFLNDDDFSQLPAIIRNELLNDGMKVNEVSVTDKGKVTIDAYYP